MLAVLSISLTDSIGTVQEAVSCLIHKEANYG
jgi:hypothetical protein